MQFTFLILSTIFASPVAQNNLAQSTSGTGATAATIDNSTNSLNLNNNTAGRDQVNVAQQNSGANQTVIGYQHNSKDTYNVNQTNYNNYQVNVTQAYNQTYNTQEQVVKNFYQINQAAPASAPAPAPGYGQQAPGYAQQAPPPAAPAQQAAVQTQYGARPSNQDVLAMIMHAKETSDAAFKLAMQLYQ